jgi:uncharacterized membrane protein (Fun14 family)
MARANSSHLDDDPGTAPSVTAARRPIWNAWSLRIAAGMVLVGLLLWVRTPSANHPPDSASAGGAGLAASAAAKDGSGAAVESKSPVLFRLGASYIAGFFFGWACRKSLRLAMLVAGAALAVIATAKCTGMLDLNWSSLQSNISQSLAWLRGGLGAARHFLTGYLPSTAAACLGIFMGARRG